MLGIIILEGGRLLFKSIFGHADSSEDGSVAYVPLVSGGQVVGVLQVEPADERAPRLVSLIAETAILGRFTQIQPLRWAVVSCPTDGTDADALLAQAEQRLRIT